MSTTTLPTKFRVVATKPNGEKKEFHTGFLGGRHAFFGTMILYGYSNWSLNFNSVIPDSEEGNSARSWNGISENVKELIQKIGFETLQNELLERLKKIKNKDEQMVGLALYQSMNDRNL